MVTRITALENGYRAWRNTTLHIYNRLLLSKNPGKEIHNKHRALEASSVMIFLSFIGDLRESIPDRLKSIQSKMEQQQDKTNRLLDELATLRNNTMDGK